MVLARPVDHVPLRVDKPVQVRKMIFDIDLSFTESVVQDLQCLGC